MSENEKVLEANEANFALAAKCVKNGGVVIAPSDTNLALTLNPWVDDAIDRAFAIKNRPATSALTLFFLNPEEWTEYATAADPGLVQAFVEAYWPGPLNIVLPKKENVPDKMVRGGSTIAMGCLSNPVWRGMMRHLDIPVTMTSANLSGQADGVLVDMRLALDQVGGKVDYILKGGAQGTTQSSTIIDLSGEPRVLRYGDITVDQLNEVAPVFKKIG
ncbi:L-threonylcarbamoyladenylate synthase [Paenibacillus sp. HN-1]|uniref:L-threonylcarbamoyladenylate synthase n=1 Tax=Paenibacillus TaxID=44249 RepID=UPI001CA80EB3|nr:MULTISPECIES: L-threonylcarbamoyladenylate synthase [Paenibacillus]MBY9080016.1 L-threonylcarbamoyladenylate synthase [Paenibacillus sp. CGMCC 1.18879]MBY9086714.1 L-threonylcarbamoyladenylate synthase [Paenibacillus sinensis]